MVAIEDFFLVSLARQVHAEQVVTQELSAVATKLLGGNSIVSHHVDSQTAQLEVHPQLHLMHC
jgi:hypothetical protein